MTIADPCPSPAFAAHYSGVTQFEKRKQKLAIFTPARPRQTGPEDAAPGTSFGPPQARPPFSHVKRPQIRDDRTGGMIYLRVHVFYWAERRMADYPHHVVPTAATVTRACSLLSLPVEVHIQCFRVLCEAEAGIRGSTNHRTISRIKDSAPAFQ